MTNIVLGPSLEELAKSFEQKARAYRHNIWDCMDCQDCTEAEIAEFQSLATKWSNMATSVRNIIEALKEEENGS